MMRLAIRLCPVCIMYTGNCLLELYSPCFHDLFYTVYTLFLFVFLILFSHLQNNVIPGNCSLSILKTRANQVNRRSASLPTKVLSCCGVLRTVSFLDLYCHVLLLSTVSLTRSFLLWEFFTRLLCLSTNIPNHTTVLKLVKLRIRFHKLWLSFRLKRWPTHISKLACTKSQVLRPDLNRSQVMLYCAQ